MKNLTSIGIGIMSLTILLILNLNHAFNNYGVTNNTLHLEVWAQSNDSGNGTGTNDSEFKCGIKNMDCCIKITAKSDLNTLKKRFPLASFELEVVTDVTNLTQIYYQGSDIKERVRCGKDITCNDVVMGTDAGIVT